MQVGGATVMQVGGATVTQVGGATVMQVGGATVTQVGGTTVMQGKPGSQFADPARGVGYTLGEGLAVSTEGLAHMRCRTSRYLASPMPPLMNTSSLSIISVSIYKGRHTQLAAQVSTAARQSHLPCESFSCT